MHFLQKKQLLPSNFDEILLQLKKLSFRGLGYSSPNPPVACVITDTSGKILSASHTQKIGKNHAEREAYSNLGDMQNTPHLVFVTLEPCSHFGRTPPCLDLILKNKPLIVYYGFQDPNPLVRSRDGISECENSGIKMIQLKEIQDIAEPFLSGFFSRIRQDEPEMIFKAAVSKEGFITSSPPQRIAISSELSNFYTNMLRAKVDAVVVGTNTVIVDSPSLALRKIDKEKYLNLKKKINVKTHGFNNLLNNIFEFFEDEIDYINENEKGYQPYRIFLMNAGLTFPAEFWQKQKALSNQYPDKKSFFIFYNADKDDEKFKVNYQKAEDFTDLIEVRKERRIQSAEIFEIIRKHVTINTILIEGGNSIYKLFTPIKKKGDSFLIIRGSAAISGGKLLEADLSGFGEIFDIEVGADEWSLRKVFD